MAQLTIEYRVCENVTARLASGAVSFSSYPVVYLPLSFAIASSLRKHGVKAADAVPRSAFGAASALAVVLVWIYYAGMLVLFGAEFTQDYAASRGHGIEPRSGAVRIERPEQIVRPKADAEGRGGSGIIESTSRADETGTRAQTRGDLAMREDRNSSRTQEMQLLPRGNGLSAGREDIHSASIGELFRRLSADSSHLIQQEIQLARTELQESAARAGKGAAKIGVSVVLALPGVMALTAALVIGIGIIINSYWLSALIVGVLILVVAAVLAKRAIADFKSGLAPKETVQTVREDVDWAKRESRRVKQELSA